MKRAISIFLYMKSDIIKERSKIQIGIILELLPKALKS